MAHICNVLAIFVQWLQICVQWHESRIGIHAGTCHVHSYMQTYLHIQTPVYLATYIPKCVHVYMYANKQLKDVSVLYIHTYIHTYRLTSIHSRMSGHAWRLMHDSYRHTDTGKFAFIIQKYINTHRHSCMSVYKYTNMHANIHTCQSLPLPTLMLLASNVVTLMYFLTLVYWLHIYKCLSNVCNPHYVLYFILCMHQRHA